MQDWEKEHDEIQLGPTNLDKTSWRMVEEQSSSVVADCSIVRYRQPSQVPILLNLVCLVNL
jgi:hypothetical protein